MPAGDAAAAAGLPVVEGTEDFGDGYIAINEVSDALAAHQTTGGHPWGNITSKPATFPPTVGTAADEAAAGNHTHGGSAITSGTVSASRLPKASGLNGLTISTSAPSGGSDGDIWLEY